MKLAPFRGPFESSKNLAVVILAVLFVAASYGAEPVTPLNFNRAETDNYFSDYVSKGGIGNLQHIRELTPISEQTIIKMNRDTLYSGGIVDVSSPITIIKPDTKGRFQSMIVIDQDHYVKMVEHGAGEFLLDKETLGTRYGMVVFRTLVDADDTADLAKAHAAQDAIVFNQDKKGSFETPDWDQEQLQAIRTSLTELGHLTPTAKGRFGREKDIDPINHLIGTAVGWGGNPPEAAVYIPITPENNDGKTPYTLTVNDVPVDGFWSISLYSSDGLFRENENDAYVINDRNAIRNKDGSITIHFGGDPKAPNYLYIMPGWQYLVRLYQPQREIIFGEWTFPMATPAK